MSLYDVLKRPRQPWDERLPDGRSVYEAAGGRDMMYRYGRDDQSRLNPLSNRPTPRIAFGANGLTGLEKPENPPAEVRFPEITPTTAPAERNPYEDYTPSASTQPPINVKLGPNLEGLSPLERQMAVLGSEQRAAQDFPSSRVSPTGEIAPPKMHHGFKDRLKSIGKGFLLGMAQADPRLGGAGGIGAGIGGAIRGGISPISIDKAQAEAAVRRHGAALDQQLELEKRRAEIERLRRVPEQKLPERNVINGEIVERQPDGTWKSVYKSDQPEKQPERNVIDGKIVERQPDGTWKPVYESPPGADKVDVRQKQERQRNYNAAQQELASLILQEKAAEEKKNAAYKAYGDLQAQYANLKDKEGSVDKDAQAAMKPQLDDAKDKAEKAQADYASYGERKTKAQQVMAANQDESTVTYEPPAMSPPGTSMVPGMGAAGKMRSRGSKPSPNTHSFSISSYMSRNKGATEADARAYAAQNYPGYAIVP